MRDITVLVSGIGGPGAPGIIKSLRLIRERKIKIVGVDADKTAIGFGMVDSHYAVPLPENRNFIPTMLKISKKEKVDVVLPLVTNELGKYAKFKEEFKKNGTIISISEPEALKIANNKYFLMKNCEANNIPVPSFHLTRSYKEFRRAIFELGYPQRNVCFKPPISRGMRGFRILTKRINRLDLLINQKPTNIFTTLEEIKPILGKIKPFPKLIVMEYLPGDEYSVDVLADNGNPIIVIPRLREKIKMGVSFVGTTVNDKEIIQYSKVIIKKLRLNGNIGLQFKKNIKGIPEVIESNPRLQGTIVLCSAAGANLVYLAVKLALGEKIIKPKIKWGTKMIRYWEEIYYDKEGHAFTF